MSKHKPPRPTDAELEILRVLWGRGPSTVRQVQEAIERTPPTGYTTVLKTLQIMTDKGLVQRDETNRTHIYEASCSEGQTQRQLLGDLLNRAFGGSSRKLVMQLLSSHKSSPHEIAEIRRLVDEFESPSSEGAES